jgi:hypothetical protein
MTLDNWRYRMFGFVRTSVLAGVLILGPMLAAEAAPAIPGPTFDPYASGMGPCAQGAPFGQVKKCNQMIPQSHWPR